MSDGQIYRDDFMHVRLSMEAEERERERSRSLAAPTGLGAAVEFVKGKLADVEKALKFREESEKVWRGGTDKSWRAVGCKMTKQQRLEVSARHGQIAAKCRREVEMFKEVLARLQAPNVCLDCL